MRFPRKLWEKRIASDLQTCDEQTAAFAGSHREACDDPLVFTLARSDHQGLVNLLV